MIKFLLDTQTCIDLYVRQLTVYTWSGFVDRSWREAHFSVWQYEGIYWFCSRYVYDSLNWLNPQIKAEIQVVECPIKLLSAENWSAAYMLNIIGCLNNGFNSIYSMSILELVSIILSYIFFKLLLRVIKHFQPCLLTKSGKLLSWVFCDRVWGILF